jgi:ribonuclease D
MKPNLFAHYISKELIHWLPVTSFEGEVIVVDSEDRIADAVAYLSKQKYIGVDTEARPSFVRGVHYPTALLQMATEERCYLFRLTHIGMPQSVAKLFANPAICKVGLAFKDDITGLRRRRDFKPQNCVDLQSIVAKYGILELGLQKIFAICFGKKISKSQQLTNWESTQLTPEQARYASTDAWATLMIYKLLSETEPLPGKETERLRRDHLRMIQEHQREVLAARQNENNCHDNNNTPSA